MANTTKSFYCSNESYRAYKSGQAFKVKADEKSSCMTPRLVQNVDANFLCINQ